MTTLAQPSQVDTQTAVVIEDNPPLRGLVRYFLEELGYLVFEASGEQSLREVLTDLDSVDLVVSDILLQGALKGPDLVPIIKAQNPEVSILYMTGFAASELISKDHICLSKPFSRAQFLDAVARVHS